MRRLIAITSVVVLVALLVLVSTSRRTALHDISHSVSAAQNESGRSPQQALNVSEATLSPSGFTFRHVVLDTSHDAPEFCLKFSADLDARAEAHYADYVAIAPAVNANIRAAGPLLCIGGLGFGTDYTITLKQGLPSSGGARLAAAETVPASLGDRAPLVDISGDGFILPRAVAHGLTVQTVNVRRVRLHVLRVSDRLLPAATRKDSQEQVQLSETGLQGYAINRLLLNSASIIWTGTMDIPPDHNRTVMTAFPIGQVIKPGMQGAYLVVAEDDAHATPESQWHGGENENYDDAFFRAKATHWVIATDIALTTFTGTDGLHVAARSLATAEPLAGVTVDLLSVGQDVLDEATTDDSGMVHFAPGLLRGHAAAAYGAITARAAGGDFTLQDLTKPAFDFSDRGVTGRPSPAPLQAFLYTERGIYRPGQNVELVALLRDRIGDAADLPLTLVLRRPNGMEARRFSQAPQPASGFHQTIALPQSAARGTWSVEALADPTGAAIGRVSFEVQDYVPQQLKVKLAPFAGALQPGQNLAIDVQGDFLYGAPANGLHGQADLRVTRDPNPIDGLQGWQFGLADETVDDKTQTIDLPPADASGHAHAVATPDPPPGAIQSPLKVVVTAGLFEPSGREVIDSGEAKLRTRAILLGLHTRFTGSAETEKDASIEIRTFSADGKPVARPSLAWRLVRENRLYDWFQGDNVWHWHYHTEDEDIAQGTIDAPADASALLTRRYDWGNYRLIVQDTQSGAASSIRFEAGWNAAEANADVPDKLTLALDKPALSAGGTGTVHIEAPFAGHASVIVANDRVIETREIDVAKGGNDISITQTRDWGAGAFVMVSLYRPLAAGTAHEPVRAVGVAWIGTDAAPRTLAVQIGAADKVLPQQDITVPIHVGNIQARDQESGKHAFVTLAAVDEGILQLTRFASPDPAGFLFGKRALGLMMRDDYGKLLDGSADPGAIQGGDEGIGGAGLPVVSTRTVALFSGLVALDDSGNAQIKLKIPDFEGQLRLMAVAYSGHSVGQAQKTMIVRDPVVADIAVPRFLAAGDDASLAVSLDDTDGAAGQYRLQVAVSGAARLRGGGEFNEALQPGTRVSRAIDIAAPSEGIADIAADLSGPDGLAVHRTWQISVRGAHAPVTLAQTAWQQKGESFFVDTNLLRPFVPGSGVVSVGYSAFGGIDVASLLQSLDRYPFGCTEQLTSTAFPLVYYGDPVLHQDLSTNSTGGVPVDRGVHDRVQQAIDTILERQGEDGAFGLWHADDGEASTWLDVYALDFLTHAKEAGFDVPDSALQRSALWLRHAADGELPDSNYKYYAQGVTTTRAYASYVLARLGRADPGGLRMLHDTLTQREADGEMIWYAGGKDDDVLEPLALGQIGGALTLMGDRSRGADAFRQAIDNLALRNWPYWWFDWSYSSPLRDAAELISVAAETGQQAALKSLLDRFTAFSTNAGSLNTQEQAALLSAAHALNKDVGTLAFTVNGAPAKLGSTPVFRPGAAAIAAGYNVRNDSANALWRTLTVTGSPTEASPPLEAGYKIEKNFYSLKGDKLEPAHMRQNDRVIVELHGYVMDSTVNRRTVIVDLLPAGWEIEAPVTQETDYGFLGPLSQTRVHEARDDRYVAALDFGADLVGWRHEIDETNDNKPHLLETEFRLAYVARAITPGDFTLPEATVQDMYRPAVMGRTASSTTDIVAR